MDIELIKYKANITKVFTIGVEVLNVARTLKRISLDLKILAINGIVQAAKVGNNQGQSLITLSSFLSALPTQIAPELEELEVLTGELSKQITMASIDLRRYILYSISINSTIEDYYWQQNEKTKLDSISINQIIKKYSVSTNLNYNNIQELNIKLLIDKNNSIVDTLNKQLLSSKGIITQSKNTIDRIRRSGFSANYMGSNISIEAAYLTRNKQNFQGLVDNIKNMINELNEKLDIILAKIHDGELLITNLIKSGITK